MDVTRDRCIIYHLAQGIQYLMQVMRKSQVNGKTLVADEE